ncbi:MAG: ribonuclease III [Candidatus Hydrogenedentes bacterium]|nr:ribonuclease III [Candidatus Hydrogenedentota bacterium]
MNKCEEKEDEWEVFFIKWARRVRLYPKSTSLYREAFTHPSYYGDVGRENETGSNFESLEFLGDAVLGLAIAEYIRGYVPYLKPGELTLVKSKIVNRYTLSNVAKRLNLQNLLILGKSEESSGGREKLSILENTLESLIGCIYLDKGWEKTKKIIYRFFSEELSKVEKYASTKDPKSELQEFCQKNKKPLPDYRVIKEEGPDHKKSFQVAVVLGDRVISIGEGGSKKEASRIAAKKALAVLKEKIF